MQIETVPIDSVRPDPANLRRHPVRNLDAIESSLLRFGQQRPILVDASGVIVAGNGTHAGARRLGWPTIAVVRTDLAGSAAVAYAIADNRAAELAEWDKAGLAETLRALESEGFDVSAAGFTAGEIDALVEGLGTELLAAAADPEGDAPEADFDRAEELREAWGTAAGQLWEAPSLSVPGSVHRLLCGSSTEPEDLRRLFAAAGDRPTAVITDPPYGVSFVRGQFNGHRAKAGVPASIRGDDLRGDDQREFVRAVFEGLRPHVHESASVYMFSASMVEGCCSYFGLLDAGVKVQGQLVWDKGSLVLGRADHHWQHEVCWYGWYPGGEAHRWYGERDKTTVIRCPRVRSTTHPNEKPTPLIEGFLRNSTLPGDRVAEPFSGSGTTLVACERLGRVGLAMELDPKFVALALQRLSEMGLQPRLAP